MSATDNCAPPAVPARPMVQPASFAPGSRRLPLESRGPELAGETPAALAQTRGALRAGERRCLSRLDELLRSEARTALPGAAPSMADIARAVGSNPTTLQLLTRRNWGCTVFERLRALRMEQAHALLRAGAGVAQAAQLAGYGGPANFATAFKRQYGYSPGQLKLRGTAMPV